MQVRKICNGNPTTKTIIRNILKGITETAPPSQKFKGLLYMNSFTLATERQGNHFTPYSTFTIGEALVGIIEHKSGKIVLLHSPLIAIKKLRNLVINHLTLLQNPESTQLKRTFVINKELWTKVS